MRRVTLITIVALLIAIAAAAVYQIVVVSGRDQDLPGPGVTPSAT